MTVQVRFATYLRCGLVVNQGTYAVPALTMPSGHDADDAAAACRRCGWWSCCCSPSRWRRWRAAAPLATDFDFNLQWLRFIVHGMQKAKAKTEKKDRLRANGWRQTNKQMSFNGHIEQRPVVAVVVGATRLATLPVKWFMPQARQGSNSNSSPKRRARSRLWLRLWLRLCLSLGIHAQLRDLATNFLVRVAEKLTVFCLRWILPRIHLALVAVEHWEKCVVPAGAYLSVFL